MKNHGFLGFLFLTTLLISSCSSNKVAELSPEQAKADLYYEQGTQDLINKSYSQALINLVKASEYNPKSTKVRTNLAMAYYLKDQKELAIKELQKAISLDSKNSDAKINLGSIYLERNDLKKARALFEEVITDLTYPNLFRAYYNLSLVSLREGDRKEAFELLAKSLREKEDYCQAHFKLGELYSEEYKYQQALKSFKEASKGICVNEPNPHYMQALTLINLNRTEEARKKLNEVIEKFPKSNFNTLATQQLRKISQIKQEQTLNNYQTEVIKENQTIESPNF